MTSVKAGILLPYDPSPVADWVDDAGIRVVAAYAMRRAHPPRPVSCYYSFAVLRTADASALVTTGTTSKSTKSFHWLIQVMSELRSSHSMS